MSQLLSEIVNNQKCYRQIVIRNGDLYFDVMKNEFITEEPKIYIDITTDNSDITQYIENYKLCCKTLEYQTSDKSNVYDPYYTRYSVQYLAKKILYEGFRHEFSKLDVNIDALDEFEQRFIKFDAKTKNDILNGKNTEKIYTPTNIIYRTNKTATEKLQTYDINSCHAYGLINYKWIFTQGAFKHMTNEELKKTSKFNNAYYKVIPEDMPYFYPQKMSGVSSYWTNYDLLIFDKMKINYTIDETEPNNAYVYKNCHEIQKIRTSINKLYDLKANKKGGQVVKQVLQNLHSVLMQKNKSDGDFVDMTDTKNVNTRIETYEDPETGLPALRKRIMKKNADTFKYNMIRNAPFIYASIRYQIVRKFLAPLNDNNLKVYRIYVDSIVCADNELMNKQLSSKIGDIKIEKKPWNGLENVTFTGFGLNEFNLN